jgi:hypothetical protein
MKIEANGFWRRGAVFIFEVVDGDVLNICQND